MFMAKPRVSFQLGDLLRACPKGPFAFWKLRARSRVHLVDAGYIRRCVKLWFATGFRLRSVSASLRCLLNLSYATPVE